MGIAGFESIMFRIAPTIIAIGFIVTFGIIFLRTIEGAHEWNSNNNSPMLTMEAKLVAKRIDISHHSTANMDMHHNSSFSSYYVTFQLAGGDRMEFNIPDKEYGLLAEGDEGKLTFQGTRYISFKRNKENLI